MGPYSPIHETDAQHRGSQSIARYADGDCATEAENAMAVLDSAGFTADDLVKVTTMLTSADDIPAYKGSAIVAYHDRGGR
jgi:hypothetical protein